MPRFLSVALPDATTPRPIHGALMSTAAKWLTVTALTGAQPDGAMAADFEGQAEQAFDNLIALLAVSGLKREDLVQVVAFVAVPGAKATIHRLATDKLGGFRPTTAVRQVVALSQAGTLIELDAQAILED